MKQTVPLGRVAGIPVGMHWSVLVMVTMIGWLLGGQVLPKTIPGQPAAAYWAVAVPCAVAFMAALLAHELAHSLVARRPAAGQRSALDGYLPELPHSLRCGPGSGAGSLGRTGQDLCPCQGDSKAVKKIDVRAATQRLRVRCPRPWPVPRGVRTSQ